MKHFAEYLIPGAFFSETTCRELTAHSFTEALRQAPDNAFAFILYDLPDVVPDSTPDYTITPRRQHVSGRCYIGGTVYSIEEVEAMGPEHAILASNMQINRWNQVIKCRTGNWQPIEHDDVVLLSPAG